MGDAALKQVEGLRREAVERARVELAAAQVQQCACGAALRELLETRARRECELARARSRFADASSVRDLRGAAALTRSLRAQLSAVEALIGRAEQRSWAAGERVRDCEAAVRAAELGRRALSRRLERNAADVNLRTERRLEDEADDAYRARMRRG